MSLVRLSTLSSINEEIESSSESITKRDDRQQCLDDAKRVKKDKKGIKLRILKPGPYDLKKTKFDLVPKVGDTVKIHYEVYLFKDNNDKEGSAEKFIQDRPFGSSRKQNLPICFVVGNNEVLEGLDIAIRSIKLGQLVEVEIPSNFAYGDQGYPPQVPPNSSICFHVELLDFTNGDVTNRK